MTEDKKIKVTDKRMFTPEGDLREDYRHLDREGGSQTEGAAAAEPPRERGTPPPAAAAEPAPPLSAGRGGERAGPGPSFLDLVGILADQAVIHLGDIPHPDGTPAVDLELARLHIDLLEVLRRKTAGNLDTQEAAILDDLLYRLRIRYVDKRR